MQSHKLPSKGDYVEIKGYGIYIDQIDLFKSYCKVLINGGYVILPIEMITMEKKDVNTHKKGR